MYVFFFSFDVEIKGKSSKVSVMITRPLSAGVLNSQLDVCPHFPARLGRITERLASVHKNLFLLSHDIECVVAVMEKRSVRYLQWKLSETEKRFEKDRHISIKDSIKHNNTENLLHDKIAALQAEVQAHTDKEDELKGKIEILENDLKEEKIRVRTSDRNIDVLSDRYSALTEEFGVYKKSAEKKLADLKDENEKIKLSMQADIINMQQVAKQHEELADKLKYVLKSLGRDFHDLKDRHNVVVEKINNYLQNEEEEKREQRLRHLREKNEIKCSTDMEKVGYENELFALQKQITKLEELKSLLPIVDSLKSTIDEKCKLIKNKNKEITSLKKEKNDVVDRLEMEQEKTAIGNVQMKLAMEKVKCLEEKNLQGEYKTESTQKALYEFVGHNEFLIEKLQHLERQVRASDAESSGLRERVERQQTYLLRFKEDLQTCMSVINEPSQLKQRVLDLRKQYIQDEKKVQIGETTETAYKFNMDCLWKKLQHASNIDRANGSIIRRWERRFAEASDTFKQKEFEYIQALNEEMHKVQQLKKDLKEKTKLLQKATKLIPQSLRSLLDLKCLQLSQVTNHGTEERPHIHTDDS